MSGFMLVLVMALTGVSAQERTAGALYERAYFLEQAEGDLQGAVELYQRILDEFPEERTFGGRALLRIGLCYERSGADGAMSAYRRILDEFSDQEELVKVARGRLAALETLYEGERRELPTGATLRELVLPTGDSIGDGNAALSPDGRRIIYYDVGLESPVVYELMSRRVVAVAHIDLTQQARYPNYRWSPDGRRIAFERYDGEAWNLHVLEVETGEYSTWLRQPDRVVPIRFTSADDLWCRSQDETGASWLLRLDRRARERARIAFDGFLPRISPKGDLVAFDGGDRDLYLARIPAAREEDDSPELSRGHAIPVAPHAAADQSPIFSPDGKYLAFLSFRTKQWDLWAVALEEGAPSGEPFIVEENLGPVNIRDWHIDGSLSFVRRNILNDVYLLSMSPGTDRPNGKPILLPAETRGDNRAPVWSTDGQTLMYRSEGAMIIADTDGAIVHRIELDLRSANASWSPDGERVLVGVYDEERSSWRVHELELASHERREVVDLSFVRAPNPDYSPDGRKILLNRMGPDSEPSGLFIVEDGSLRQIPGVDSFAPAKWSPDGQWIAFPEERSLWRIRPDGSDRQLITEVPEPEVLGRRVSWSPDGRFIVYPRSRITRLPQQFDRELWVVAVDGSSERKLEETGPYIAGSVDWSPDGRHLAFVSWESRYTLWLLENFWPNSSTP